MRKTTLWLTVILGLSQIELCLVSAENALDQVNGQHLVLHETDLHVTWELLNPTGDVAGYKVTWQDKEKKLEIVWPFLHEEITLKNMTSFTCLKEFNVTIAPYNVDFGPVGSEETRKYTWQDVVTNISLSNDKSTIHASWSVTCPSKAINKFIVTWRSEERGFERACVYPGSAFSTSNPLECFGDPPHQCSHYHVRIQPADSSAGDVGVPAENSLHTQLETFHSVQELQHLELDSDSVTLTWRKPRPQCPVTGYIVSYSGTALWGEQKRHVGSVRVDETHYSTKNTQNNGVEVELVHYGKDTTAGVIRNLMPYSIYEICVSDTSEKNNTRSCIKIETKEIKPDAPVLLSVNEVNQTSLKLTWNSPLNIKGILKGFIVCWNRDNEAIERAVVLEETYTIVGLAPCEKYTITVSASTSAGEGGPIRTNGATADGCNTSHTHIIVGVLLLLTAIIAMLAYAWTRPEQNKQNLRKSATATSMLSEIRFSALPNADGVHAGTEKLSNASSEETMVVGRSRGDEREEAFLFQKHKMKSDQSTAFFISKGLCQDEVYNFLSVIWENNVKIIIMLDNSYQYWPVYAREEKNWKDFSVRAMDEADLWRSYKVQTVTLGQGDEKKYLKQYHIKDYLKMTLPNTTYVTTELINEVLTALDDGPSTTILFSSSDDMVENFVTEFDEKLGEKKKRYLSLMMFDTPEARSTSNQDVE